MKWEARSNENLRAAQLCQGANLFAAALTRYYYAVYQRAVGLLEQVGPGAPSRRDGRDYWPHELVGAALADVLDLEDDVEDRYELLRVRPQPPDASSTRRRMPAMRAAPT